jgi:transposase-like protein
MKRAKGIEGAEGVGKVERVKVERVEGVGKGVEVELERRSKGGVKVRPRCPWCGGEAFKDGFRVTREGRKQRYQCKSCGHKFTLQS